MARSLIARRLACVCLVLMLAGLARLPHVRGDQKCYQSITNVPCPTAPETDTCGTQFSNLPADQKVWQAPFTGANGTAKPSCEGFSYNARQSGQYGGDCCTEPGVETGTKCVPQTDDQGVTVRGVCASQYKCSWGGTEGGCSQSNDKVKDFEAVLYMLDKTGCLPIATES